MPSANTTATTLPAHFSTDADPLVNASVNRRRNPHHEEFAHGDVCPNCHESKNIEDNGCNGSNLTYLCTDCGPQWDALDYEV